MVVVAQLYECEHRPPDTRSVFQSEQGLFDSTMVSTSAPFVHGYRQGIVN